MQETVESTTVGSLSADYRISPEELVMLDRALNEKERLDKKWVEKYSKNWRLKNKLKAKISKMSRKKNRK